MTWCVLVALAGVGVAVVLAACCVAGGDADDRIDRWTGGR